MAVSLHSTLSDHTAVSAHIAVSLHREVSAHIAVSLLVTPSAHIAVSDQIAVVAQERSPQRAEVSSTVRTRRIGSRKILGEGAPEVRPESVRAVETLRPPAPLS